jgi:2-hydroxyacyl-CoA lyase 1
VIINNNGIGGGFSELDPQNVPPSAYTIGARYEKMIEAFGGKGYFADTPDALSRALKEALSERVPTIVNVMIDPRAGRKPQKFNWLTR